VKAPTVKQARHLRVLASGAIAIAPSRGDWAPLIRRGWVEPISPDDRDKRFLPPVRITPDGLRALADAMEKYPELTPEMKPAEFPQLNESPTVTELKAKLSEAREKCESAGRRAPQLRSGLARCKAILETIEETR
jgi:hypothetical protein